MTDDSIAQLRSRESKVCTKCEVRQPLSEFSKNRTSKGGVRPDCKACRKAFNRAHYAKYREKVLERQKRRYAENPERFRAYHRLYYTENKSEVLRKSKIWKEANRERYSEQQKQYAYQNREAANERVKRWNQNNPEKVRAIRRAHHTKRRATLKSGVTMAAVLQWLEQQDPICFYCGADCSDGKFEVDHFHPLARGGAHELDNLRIACRPCNRRKSARDPYEFMANMEP